MSCIDSENYAKKALITTGGPEWRGEIHGLRTLAAGLVGVYHIWFDRVSGGVDVFFVVSGFLITGSLYRSAARSGQVPFRNHLVRIARRILPAAFAVLVISVPLTLIFISPVFWEDTLREIVAAGTYLANWEFSRSAVDYLAVEEFQSPVLHFWALSLQGQFYLLWPIVIWLTVILARRRNPGARDPIDAVHLRRVVVTVLVLVAFFSFAYASLRVRDHQIVTYYDTAARLWEFALGGLIAVGWRRRLSAVWAGILSAIGVIAIALTGLLFDVSALFPGWPALLPTGGAALILMAGTQPDAGGGLRLLKSRLFVALGDISYAFFLWQWTILSFVKIGFDLDQIGLILGAGIMLAAGLAAWMTHLWIETPFLRRRSTRPHRLGATELIGAASAVVVLIVSFWMVQGPDTTDAVTASGATVSTTTDKGGTDESAEQQAVSPLQPPVLMAPHSGPLEPDPRHARRDRPIVYDNGCHQRQDRSEVIECVFGSPGGVPVALVGGSHAAQWLPALDEIGQRHGWEIRSITRSACRFGRRESAPIACQSWVENVQNHLLETRPVYAIVMGTTGSSPGERIPEGSIELWSELVEEGIGLIAIRDNPWHPRNPPECVLDNGPASPLCSASRAERLAVIDPLRAHPSAAKLMEQIIDMTAWLCDATTCPVVSGKYLMYRDGHHLTVAYVRYLAPIVESALLEVIEPRQRLQS